MIFKEGDNKDAAESIEKVLRIDVDQGELFIIWFFV